ncbi:MBL fold metallo-hydrolase [Rhodococcus sp. G-MC3]|uniref:MBL fold metallo-hydrolase n=1 Tax=Rhodococcus sp. G-MC3 TaxID=3046209 RepID=UPI0024BA04F9|nr:MBL fold metallo-hydrolase [Rhodococcus sp. G-MC3]MDJ0396648.1 MBL fold metallo-hydrolase [Rhodococcus sp. G-MC3]
MRIELARMKMTHVRNATMLIDYDNSTVLIDPMLGARGSMDPFPAVSGNTARNPMVDLVVPLERLVTPDVVVVTHTHADHWDAAAASMLPREVPILVQHAEDADIITGYGFTDVRILDEPIVVSDIEFTRTSAQHSSDEILEALPSLGQVMGVILRRDSEPTVYVAGDTVMTDNVRDTLRDNAPDIVVLNTGGATPTPMGPIIMSPDDVEEVARLAPRAHIVSVHMEALNHCPVTREDVHREAALHGITDRISIPEDGECLTF